ncbi:MAG TPA: fibronectin type III domain-containing protein [Candidatus Angelobacter sp.]|nr:fibronectin type III domain-containing protein [Candidatus Angelobacter sp.]
MRKGLAILLTATALTGWTFAQDAEDKHDQAQPAPQTQPANGTSKNDNGKALAKVTITNGPNVTPQDTSATIAWTTAKNAATFVRYGTDANNLDQKYWQAGGSKSHSVNLSNLQPGTLYYFAIMTDDDKVRAGGQFQTTGQSAGQAASGQAEQGNSTQPPAANPPAPASAPQTSGGGQALSIVKGPDIEFVTPNAVVIDWSTDARSSSVVHYGTDKNNLDQTAEAPWGSSFHRVTIQNLQPNTTYYFVAESSQAQGTGSGNKSTMAGFQTPAPGSQAQYNPPVIH